MIKMIKMKKMKITAGLCIIGSLLLANGTFGQDYQWVKTVGGSSTDQGTGIATDPSGNVITIGQFWASVDIDPGAGTTTLTSQGNEDCFIQKLDANGNFLWAGSIGGTLNDYASAIALDASGNIFITGSFYGTTDFDPGVGINNMTSQGAYDGFVLKLDVSGNFLWVRTFDGATGTGLSEGNSLRVDATGNVYTAGFYEGNVDFDPSAGNYNLTAQAGGIDIFVQKMDNNGNFLWAKGFGGANNMEGEMTLDAAGNVFITGYYQGTVDFDPGMGISNLTSVFFIDAFLLKLDANGNFVWVKEFGGNGAEQGRSVVVDPSGNIYVTGYNNSTADFDPGAGVFNLTTGGQGDIFVVKLDINGDFLWAKNTGGTLDENATEIALDTLGNMYIMGTFVGTADFDPSVNVANITSSGQDDGFILKLDPSGNYLWAVAAGGTSYDYFRAFALGSGSIYLTGTYQFTVDFDPSAGTANATAIASYDAFVWKLSQCSPDATTDVQAACESYLWIDGNTYTSSNSTATHTLTNVEGCDSIVTLNLTITNIDASVTDNSPALTANQAGASYQWIDCNNGNAAIVGATNQTFTATANGNYAVVVTQNNCSATSTCSLVENVGLNDLEEELVLLYPNPAHDIITVDFGSLSNEKSVELRDASGRKLQLFTVAEKQVEMEVSAYQSGVYFVVISSEHGEQIHRFVKQ